MSTKNSSRNNPDGNHKASTKAAIGASLFSLIGIGIVALMVIGPLAIGFMGQLDREAKTRAAGHELAKANYDEYYKTLCPTYKMPA